jgi:hypothetical protein
MATAAKTRDEGPSRPRLWRRWADPVSPRSPALWFGLVAPQVALAAWVGIGDLIFELGCARGVRPVGGRREILGLPLEAWGLILTAAVSALVITSGLMAFGAWRRVRGRRGIAVQRAHAMALGGVALSLFYLLFFLFTFPVPFFLHTCTFSL